MEISNNNDTIPTQKSTTNDQIVKKDDLWLDCPSEPEKSENKLSFTKHSSSKELESHHSKIEVKIEPKENFIYQYSESKDSEENQSSSPKKTKKIHKGHQQNDKIDNSLYSNSNRKLVNVILKFIEFLPDCSDFKSKYLNRCEINGDRENIVILPFLVLDFFLEAITKVYVQEMNQYKIIIFNEGLKEKINLLFTVLRGIFSEYRLGIEKSREKKSQKKPNSEANEKLLKTFINMADFFNNKIPELFLDFVSKKFQIRREDLNFLLRTTHEEVHGTQVKIEDEQTIRFFEPSKEKFPLEQIKMSYSISIVKECKKYIETIFPFKEREISYAYDRFFSVRLGLTHLREVFEFPHDYMLDLKKILFNSKAEEHKRESGRGKRASPYQMEKIYNRLKPLNQDAKGERKKIDLLGGEFLMALMTISLMKEKHIEVLNNFLAAINRKIQYLFNEQELLLNKQSEFKMKYEKSHYNHFIYLLSQGLQDKTIEKISQSDKKNEKSSQKKMGICLRISLSEWIYPPFFESKNYLCKIEEEEVEKYNESNLNLLREMKSVYIKAQREFEGEIQEDGITLIFDEE